MGYPWTSVAENPTPGTSGHMAWTTAMAIWGNDVHEQTFNVKDYGATGNGSTNDTSAIQATINACEAGVGGIVFFPPGTYRTTATINVAPGTILMGHGEKATTIDAQTASGQWAIQFNGGGTGDNHIGGGMEKMSVFANTNAGQNGVRALATHRMKFRDLHIDGGSGRSGTTGLAIEEQDGVNGSEWNTLDSIMVRRFSGNGFQIHGYSLLWGNRNTGINLWAEDCGVGFSFADCDTNVMQVRPQNCDVGVHMRDNAKYNALDIHEEGSYVTGLKFSGYVWQNFITGGFSDPWAFDIPGNQASHATRWNTAWVMQGPDADNIYGTSIYGIFGADPVAQQTVTGSRGGNAALASLLTALDNFGFIINNTT